jgi:hypothetical protein
VNPSMRDGISKAGGFNVVLITSAGLRHGARQVCWAGNSSFASQGAATTTLHLKQANNTATAMSSRSGWKASFLFLSVHRSKSLFWERN